MARQVTVEQLERGEVNVDLWGSPFTRAVITRSRQRQMRVAEAELDRLAVQEAELEAERDGRPPSLEELELDAERDDAFVRAFGLLLDVILQAPAVNGDGPHPLPSALVWDRWEADEIGRDLMMRLLQEIGEQEEDPTAASPPAR